MIELMVDVIVLVVLQVLGRFRVWMLWMWLILVVVVGLLLLVNVVIFLCIFVSVGLVLLICIGVLVIYGCWFIELIVLLCVLYDQCLFLCRFMFRCEVKLLLIMLLVMLKWVELVVLEGVIIWLVNRLVCIVFGWLIRKMCGFFGSVMLVVVFICGVLLLVFQLFSCLFSSGMILVRVVLLMMIKVLFCGCSQFWWKLIRFLWVRLLIVVLLLLLVNGMVYGWFLLYSSGGSMCIVIVFGLIFFCWMFVIQFVLIWLILFCLKCGLCSRLWYSVSDGIRFFFSVDKFMFIEFRLVEVFRLVFSVFVVLVKVSEFSLLVFLVIRFMVKLVVFGLWFWLVLKLFGNWQLNCIIGILWCLVRIILVLFFSVVCCSVGNFSCGNLWV